MPSHWPYSETELAQVGAAKVEAVLVWVRMTAWEEKDDKPMVADGMLELVEVDKVG